MTEEQGIEPPKQTNAQEKQLIRSFAKQDAVSPRLREYLQNDVVPKRRLDKQMGIFGRTKLVHFLLLTPPHV